MFECTCCDSQIDDELDEFLQRAEGALVYYSSAYRRFLNQILPDAYPLTLIAREDGRIVGLLPSFVQIDPESGAVANSMPFFGSHGGAIVERAHENREDIASSLYTLFSQQLCEHSIVSATIVENLFVPISERQRNILNFDAVDDRIGQFTHLPSNAHDIEESLFAMFHQKTRNAVRKGIQCGYSFNEQDDSQSLHWLQATHDASISALGGVVKPPSIFHALTASFHLGNEARLWLARADGKPVAGILFIVFERTLEYFTPVVDPEFREKQALSALIFHCMGRFAREGYNLWNWGGTWRSQEGVARFKSRWGASQRIYRYFNQVSDKSLLAKEKEVLRAQFPWFYVCRY